MVLRDPVEVCYQFITSTVFLCQSLAGMTRVEGSLMDCVFHVPEPLDCVSKVVNIKSA